MEFKKGRKLTTSDINRYFSLGELNGNEIWVLSK